MPWQQDAAADASYRRTQAGRPGCEAWACRAALQALPVAGPVLGCLQASNTQSSSSQETMAIIKDLRV